MSPITIIDESGAPVDLTQIPAWDGEGGGIQPPGWYSFEITDVALEQSSKGNPQLVLTLTVLSGDDTQDNNGRTTKHWVALTAKAAGRFVNMCNAVGLAVSPAPDEQDFIGRQFRAEVFENHYKETDPVQGDIDKVSYKIRKEMPIDNGEAPAAAPEAAAAPAQAAPPPAAPAQAAPAQAASVQQKPAPARPAQPAQPRVAGAVQARPGQRLPSPSARK